MAYAYVTFSLKTESSLTEELWLTGLCSPTAQDRAEHIAGSQQTVAEYCMDKNLSGHLKQLDAIEDGREGGAGAEE